jgi:hypothetical protein
METSINLVVNSNRLVKVLILGSPRASKGTGPGISSLLPAPNSIDRGLNCQLKSESLALLALPTDTLRYSCGQMYAPLRSPPSRMKQMSVIA